MSNRTATERKNKRFLMQETKGKRRVIMLEMNRQNSVKIRKSTTRKQKGQRMRHEFDDTAVMLDRHLKTGQTQ